MGEEFRADLGRTTVDYSRHRAGFPDAFSDRIAAYGAGGAGRFLLDLGPGTGTTARGFARRGVRVPALEPSTGMPAAARRTGEAEGAAAAFRAARDQATRD